MRFNHEKHHRRSIRLQGYHYAQAGAYFVTICYRQGIAVILFRLATTKDEDPFAPRARIG